MELKQKEIKENRNWVLILWLGFILVMFLGNAFGIDLTTLVIFFMGLACFVVAANNFKLRLRIKNTPTSKIKTAEFKSEFIKIKAVSWPLVDIKSIFGESVVYYHLSLQRYESEKWINIAKYDSRQSYMANNGLEDANLPAFLALDGTGAALIMENVIDGWLSQNFLKNEHIELEENKTELLKNALCLIPKIDSIDFYSNDRYRFTERKILTGSPLFILSKYNPIVSNSYVKAFGNPNEVVDILKSESIQLMLSSSILDSSVLQKRIFDSCKSCLSDKYSEVEISGVFEAFDASKHMSGKPHDVMIAPLTEYEVLNNKSKWGLSIVLTAIASIILLSLFVWKLKKGF